MKMYFDADEVVKVRLYLKTYEVTKNRIANFLLKNQAIKGSTVKEMKLEEIILCTYLPTLISIQCDNSNPNLLTLVPINFKIEVSDELLEFLISE